MSIRIMTLAWQTTTTTHTEKLVLLALADNANDAGECWPSISTIAKKCSLSRQGVLNQILKLEKAKILKSARVHGRVNRYTLNIKPVNAIDQSTPLTSQPSGPLPVNTVDHYQSTPLTGLVYAVDTNRHKPSIEPSIEPSSDLELAFDDPEFVEAWSDWKQHREEKRKPLTPTSIKMQLKTLKALGLDRAIRAIDFSIEKGYTGIFEPSAQAIKPYRVNYDNGLGNKCDVYR